MKFVRCRIWSDSNRYCCESSVKTVDMGEFRCEEQIAADGKLPAICF
ncbi:hypothetical protein [[Ruminococcus] torques]